MEADNSNEDVIAQLPEVLPNHLVKKMPIYMNNILAAVSHQNIQCSFCLEAVLNYVGNLAQIYDYTLLEQMHDSEESFVEGCIECVSGCYIQKSLESFKEVGNMGTISRKKFCNILKQCKERAKEKRSKRHRDEMYLGKLSFPNELSRSFDEFLAITINMLGFLPFKVN
jgi:hypothetical protein